MRRSKKSGNWVRVLKITLNLYKRREEKGIEEKGEREGKGWKERKQERREKERGGEKGGKERG